MFAGFVAFSAFENFYLRRVFSNSHSSLDGWISALIVIRNVIVLLNFIPFIQILGMMLGMYAVWVYVPLYAILIGIRYARTKHSAQI